MHHLIQVPNTFVPRKRKRSVAGGQVQYGDEGHHQPPRKVLIVEKMKMKDLLEEDEEADQVQEGQHGGEGQQGSFLFGSPR
jgi:hypothetical protein